MWCQQSSNGSYNRPLHPVNNYLISFMEHTVDKHHINSCPVTLTSKTEHFLTDGTCWEHSLWMHKEQVLSTWSCCYAPRVAVSELKAAVHKVFSCHAVWPLKLGPQYSINIIIIIIIIIVIINSDSRIFIGRNVIIIIVIINFVDVLLD